MTISESIRNTVRNIINSYGANASRYSFSSATKTTNEEGEDTVSNWGTATSIKVIGSNHYYYKKLMEMMGIESNESERVFLVRDDVTIEAKDKITINSDNYEVTEIKKIDPIEGILIAKRLELSKNVRY